MKLRVARKVEKRVHTELNEIADQLEGMMAVRSPLDLIKARYKGSTWNKATSRTWKHQHLVFTEALSVARTQAAPAIDRELFSQIG